MKKLTFIALFLLVGSLSVQFGSAQEHSDHARRKIEQFKKMKMIEVLDMETAVAERFFIVYNDGQRSLDQARESLREAVRTLHELIDTDSATEAQITAATDRVIKAHHAVEEARATMTKNIREVLSARQFASYVILEARFWDEVKQRLEQMRDRRGRRSRR